MAHAYVTARYTEIQVSQQSMAHAYVTARYTEVQVGQQATAYAYVTARYTEIQVGQHPPPMPQGIQVDQQFIAIAQKHRWVNNSQLMPQHCNTHGGPFGSTIHSHRTSRYREVQVGQRITALPDTEVQVGQQIMALPEVQVGQRIRNCSIKKYRWVDESRYCLVQRHRWVNKWWNCQRYR